MEGRPLENLELLTLAEKDEQYYKKWIEDDIQEIAQRCLGARTWIKFRNAITVFSRFGYFFASLFHEKPTPGEEFCDANINRSSLAKKFLMVALNNDLQLPPEIPRQYVKFIRDVHMVTFFLFGDFYELAKRATGYTYSTGDMTTYESKYLNRLLGLLALAQIFIKPPMLPKETKNQVDSIEYPTQSSNTCETEACQLCSGIRKEPTSTICGHIFCWSCIHVWIKDRGECPLCRTPTEPSRLIHLINFR